MPLRIYSIPKIPYGDIYERHFKKTIFFEQKKKKNKIKKNVVLCPSDCLRPDALYFVLL